MMPISDPRDRFFYPHHTLMKDTYNPSCPQILTVLQGKYFNCHEPFKSHILSAYHLLDLSNEHGWNKYMLFLPSIYTLYIQDLTRVVMSYEIYETSLKLVNL